MNLGHLSPGELRRVEAFADSFARNHGYADAECMGVREPLDVLREEVETPGALLDLACNADWMCDARIGRALKAAIDGDDLHACDLLRDVLNPLIDAEVDKRAKAEGVGKYFDLMAVAA